MVDLSELSLDVPGIIDKTFLLQCTVIVSFVLLKNNGPQHPLKLYSRSRRVFVHFLGLVKIRWRKLRSLT